MTSKQYKLNAIDNDSNYLINRNKQTKTKYKNKKLKKKERK